MVFRQDFVIIMTMIGIISLAGVVVNNAIVLIDYTNLLFDRKKRELGLGEDDPLPFIEIVPLIIQGGRTRLRPVLLTAITTVLGLLPLAIGINVDFVSLLAEYDPKIYIGGDNNIFWKPMSWAIIYGLTFATFLTLVIVPIMMWYLTRADYKWLKRLPVGPTHEPRLLDALQHLAHHRRHRLSRWSHDPGGPAPRDTPCAERCAPWSAPIPSGRCWHRTLGEEMQKKPCSGSPFTKPTY